jgi:hypothetical protein
MQKKKWGLTGEVYEQNVEKRLKKVNHIDTNQKKD